jgi:hypothetical protein
LRINGNGFAVIGRSIAQFENLHPELGIPLAVTTEPSTYSPPGGLRLTLP